MIEGNIQIIKYKQELSLRINFKEMLTLRTIRCPECGEWFEGSDHIVMDKMNNLNHKSCSDAHPSFIKDEGTYEEITNKYIFSKRLEFINEKKPLQ